MTRPFRLGLLVTGFIVFVTIMYMSFGSTSTPAFKPATATEPFGGSIGSLGLSETLLTGGSIAPKLENATAKAELGRASWKLLHTMMARFPDTPTPDDSLALQTYIQLFARLYPCGDCASHFQTLLQEYPPQVSSRNAAAGWACFVHNEVNTRLKKELFDCSKIGDFYDCGCGEDGKDGGKGGHGKVPTTPESGGNVDEDGNAIEAKAEAAPPPLTLGGEASIVLEKEEG
ncbi:FAD-linked sulfhydryl oxidase ERV2 [Sporothrix schenckii 1099-18]|uniref:Sulfhydryl oxidase n=2 Tax=Sporothrix schenckii TaxID=29908 RepID=U7PLN3_SPOS1|nr:FAD-linked sulfhydryl oxidase ERV2 [Sporothrix schenckii 1099-18]ERS95654.1 hypothetical protein HMPREF1624_07728 [Sporothrix schenckii ATCC 58251]KJR83669.1 FAD-linked sulfhydryl oxidase ERV2 [Sporothrix schenckii 1099-18]